MKTITASFDLPGRLQARASFRILPSEAPIAWTGDPQPLLSKLQPPGYQLPKMADAETFERAMKTLATRAGIKVEVSSVGEWDACEE